MKNSVIIILLIATIMSSCKNTHKHEEHESQNEMVHDQETDMLSATWMDNIQLDNNAKWEANLETTEGVEQMQELLKTQPATSIADYHQLAGKLNDVKNKVVKECTMKGASHDNLHIWLYPLIEKISALSEIETLEDASKTKQNIEAHLNAYSTYFQ